MQYLYAAQPTYTSYYYNDENWCGSGFGYGTGTGFGFGTSTGTGTGTGTGNDVLCVTAADYGEIGRAVL